jgi:hypothetical protein
VAEFLSGSGSEGDHGGRRNLCRPCGF